MVEKVKELLKSNKIEAMLPKYVDGVGNCTEIITSESSYIKNITVETCIKSLADFYNISLCNNRLNYGAELGMANKVPIVINENLIYIYINVRKPLFNKDAAYGYIAVNTVDEIIPKGRTASVKMKSGRIIETRQSVVSVKKMMLYAKMARQIYKYKNFK